MYLQEKCRAKSEPLLDSFDQNFKMVTVQGQSIGLAEVKTYLVKILERNPL